MFFVLGLCILLASLLVLNSTASLVASLLWKVFGRRITRWSGHRSAQTLFLLITAPLALGLIGVFFFLGPAYLRHEPRVGHEDVSVKLAILSTLSAIAIAVAIGRGIATWRSTNRLTADWLLHAEPIQIPTINVPTFQVEHKFPLIAVVGAFRQRLFIAKQVFDTLTPAELAAALEHETGHILAHDNLKRALVRACRDLVSIPGARGLDRAWLEASEAAADEFAVRRSRKISLDLASALVKIARMIPPGAHPTMAGAFLANDESALGFRARVRHLVSLADDSQEQKTRAESVSEFQLARFIPVALSLLLIALTSQSQVLPTVHAVIEHAVYILD